MIPATEDLMAAQKALNDADVPKNGRFYRYTDEHGNIITVDMGTERAPSPLLKDLFPCLRSNK